MHPVLRWISKVAFVVVCAVVAGIILVLTVLPRMTGGAALTVLTGSMTPDIPVGAVVLIRPVDPQTLEVGDVATYQVSPESRALVTHRVVGVEGTGGDLRFEFKGDANRGVDDKLVPPQAIRGEVWFHVPFLGSLRDAVQGMNLVILLAPPVLGLYAVYLLVSGARDRRRLDPAPAPDRPLLAARFRRADLDSIGEDPEELARRWGGVAIATDDEAFTVLLASDPDRVEDATTLLRGLGPEAMWSGSGLDGKAWRPLETTAEVRDVPA